MMVHHPSSVFYLTLRTYDEDISCKCRAIRGICSCLLSSNKTWKSEDVAYVCCKLAQSNTTVYQHLLIKRLFYLANNGLRREGHGDPQGYETALSQKLLSRTKWRCVKGAKCVLSFIQLYKKFPLVITRSRGYERLDDPWLAEIYSHSVNITKYHWQWVGRSSILSLTVPSEEPLCQSSIQHRRKHA